MDKDLINDLDDAIKHCEEEAKEQRWQAEVWEKNSDYQNTAAEYLACAKEHEQLAEWLKELKSFKEGQNSQWIPITYRPLTVEERIAFAEHYGVEYCDTSEEEAFDCPMPEDGQEILISTSWGVVEDVADNDIDGEGFISYGLEINGDWDGVDAWMPKPEPYKKEGEEK